MTTELLVLPDRFVKGAVKLKDGKATAKDGEVTHVFEMSSSPEAWEEQYPSDAHCTAYRIKGEETIPRLRKEWPENVPGYSVELIWAIADIDNPAHSRWPEGTNFEGLIAAIRKCGELGERAGIYFTRSGYRLVWPLEDPVPASVAEPMISELLQALNDKGIQADKQCNDWTRLYRMPRVVREGELLDLPMEFSQMNTIDLRDFRPSSLPEPKGDPEEWVHHSIVQDASKLHSYAQAVWRDEMEELAKIESGIDLNLERNPRLFRIVARLANFIKLPWAAWDARILRKEAIKRVRNKGIRSWEDTIERAIEAGIEEPARVPRHLTEKVPDFESLMPQDVDGRQTKDRGRANVLSHKLRGRLFYNSATGWFFWDGSNWLNYKGVELHAASEISKELHDDGSPLAIEFDDAPKLERAAKMLAAEPRVQIDPNEFDSQPYLILFQNGVYDLTDRELREPRPEDKLIKQCSCNYVPEAKSELWEKTLLEIASGDEEFYSYLQRMTGYSITASMEEQCMFILQGAGSNGKSTFVEAVQETLGEYSSTVSSDTFLKGSNAHPEALARLKGKRMAVLPEPPGGFGLDEAKVKAYSAGDTVAARHMYASTFEFQSLAKIWIVCNPKPEIDDVDDGIWRRIRLLPFREQFKGDRKDPSLPAKLRLEKEAIAAWAIEGAKQWMERGLDEPKRVIEATDEYRSEENHLLAFLEEAVVVDRTLDDREAIGVYDLRALYTSWCNRVGTEPMASKELSRSLKMMDIPAVKVGNKRRFRWVKKSS